MNTPSLRVAALALGTTVFISGCATLTSPFRDADERWADYKNWTMVNEGEPSTGDPTGFIGNVHMGAEGYRNVYVNEIGRDLLLSEGPYDYPLGTVVIKEQFANKADWEAGKNAAHTVSLKVANNEGLVNADWEWADSYKGSAGKSDFCAGCHSIATSTDFVFTNGAFIAKEKAKL